MNRTVRKIIQVVSLIAGLYLIGIGYIAWNLWTFTDVDDYRDHLEKWNPSLVRHFPRQVDDPRGDARLSYFPGFLQGGAHIQLQLTASADTVAKQVADYSENAIRIVDLAAVEENEPRDTMAADTVPYPPHHTRSDRDRLDFPARFTLYYLIAKPGTTDGFPWNHGRTAGLAISRQPPELVYWAESW